MATQNLRRRDAAELRPAPGAFEPQGYFSLTPYKPTATPRSVSPMSEPMASQLTRSMAQVCQAAPRVASPGAP